MAPVLPGNTATVRAFGGTIVQAMVYIRRADLSRQSTNDWMGMASEASRDPPNETLVTAIGEYVLGEVSLGNAAEKAGLSRWEFEDRLFEAGFKAFYGSRTGDELAKEIESTSDLE